MAKFGRYLLIATQVVLLFIVLARFPQHLNDAEWPAHAKAHLITQIFASVGLSVVILFILYGSYFSAKKWVWSSLTALGAFVFGGYWLGALFAEPEISWRSGHIIFAILSGCYLLGLGLLFHRFMIDERND
jgi:hypothetical protein